MYATESNLQNGLRSCHLFLVIGRLMHPSACRLESHLQESADMIIRMPQQFCSLPRQGVSDREVALRHEGLDRLR